MKKMQLFSKGFKQELKKLDEKYNQSKDKLITTYLENNKNKFRIGDVVFIDLEGWIKITEQPIVAYYISKGIKHHSIFYKGVKVDNLYKEIANADNTRCYDHRDITDWL